MSIFKGSAVAIITPFTEDGSAVNYDEFARLIDFQIDNGTDCIVVAGTTGEASTMSEKEHLEAVKFGVEYVKGRVPVVGGSGSNCTATAIELSREIASYGADGLLVVTPYYNKATQNGLYAHYSAIAKEVGGCPIIVYNVPGRTGTNVLPDTMARLAKDVPNIVGIKEATGNISQVVKLMAATDGNIELYSGNDDQVVPLLSMGGLGVISVVANIAPKAMHDLCYKFFEGDTAGAAAAQRSIQELFEAMFCEVNPIPVKKAVEMLGFKTGPLRMPLSEAEPAHIEQIRRAMQNFGII